MERRYGEIDALKAAGIVTVVMIHAIRSPWDVGVTGIEVWLGHVTRFGVPAFLFASGFLYATSSRVTAAVTGRRLRRIGVPYLLASLLAFAVFANRAGTGSTGDLALDLLLGSALGPFYYVFVIAGLVLATPLFARLGPRGLGGVAAVAIAGQWLVDAATLWLLPLEWHLRNPLLWWGYFLAGWWVRTHQVRLCGWLAPRSRGLVALLLALVAFLSGVSALEGEAPRLLVRTAAWLNVWAILACVFCLRAGRGAGPAWVAFLSDASYPVYLFHLFCVFPLQDAIPAVPDAFTAGPVLVPWLAGIAAPLALVAVGRRVLGERSRDWLGA